MSRYQSTLEARAREAEGAREQWIAKLRLAGYRARRGQADGLAEICSEARQIFAPLGDPIVFAHINFAEAMRDYFDRGYEIALEKLRRADALCSVRGRQSELPMLVKGWLAHISRIREDWIQLYNHSVGALSGECERSGEGIARISIVIADCLQQLRMYREADLWYAEARVRANSYGDDLVVASVMYNRPSCRVFNLRIDQVEFAEGGPDARLSEIEAESVTSFSEYIQDTSMSWALDWLKAQVMVHKKDFVGAIGILDPDRTAKMSLDWPSVGAVRAADILLCQSRLGAVTADEIVVRATDLEARIVRDCDAGDRVVAYRSLIAAPNGVREDAAIRLRSLVDESLAIYRSNLERQRTAVQDVFQCVGGDRPSDVFGAS